MTVWFMLFFISVSVIMNMLKLGNRLFDYSLIIVKEVALSNAHFCIAATALSCHFLHHTKQKLQPQNKNTQVLILYFISHSWGRKFRTTKKAGNLFIKLLTKPSHPLLSYKELEIQKQSFQLMTQVCKRTNVSYLLKKKTNNVVLQLLSVYNLFMN